MSGKRAGISVIGILLFSCTSMVSQGSGTTSPTLDVKRTYTVAVVPLKSSEYVKQKDLDILYDMVAMGLLRTGIFKVVERNRIEDLMKELKFQYSGLVDESTAKEFGKMLGADMVAMYDVINAMMRRDEYGKAYMMELIIKLVNVKTGEIVYFGRGTGYGATKGEAMENAVSGAMKHLYKMIGKK